MIWKEEAVQPTVPSLIAYVQFLVPKSEKNSPKWNSSSLIYFVNSPSVNLPMLKVMIWKEEAVQPTVPSLIAYVQFHMPNCSSENNSIKWNSLLGWHWHICDLLGWNSVKPGTSRNQQAADFTISTNQHCMVFMVIVNHEDQYNSIC